MLDSLIPLKTPNFLKFEMSKINNDNVIKGIIK